MARTAEQIQRELDALPSGGSINIHNDTPQKQAERRAALQKRRTLQSELTTLQGTDNYTTSTIEGAAQTAMEETQRRAEEDRKLALAGVTEREIKALDAITNGRTLALEAIASGSASAIEAIHTATQQGISQYAGTEELLRQGMEEVSPEREAEMFEAGRVGIEAGTQAGKRRIQETYARGGAPGSAAMRMMGDVESAGQGQLSTVQRNINLDRYNKIMGLTSASSGIAGAKAGIYGQQGQNLTNIYGQQGQSTANIYGQAGQNTANIYGQTGRTLADIYANTITAVPDYSQVPGIGSGYNAPRLPFTTSGGVRRSTTPRKRTTPNFETVKMWGG